MLATTAVEAAVDQKQSFYQAAVSASLDGTYVAKTALSKGKLVMPFRGRITSTTSSKFQMPWNGSILDGTTRLRDFPSPWKLPTNPDDGNCAITMIQVPQVVIFREGSAYGLNAFEAPAIVNTQDIAAGDALVIKKEGIGEETVKVSVLKKSGKDKYKLKGIKAIKDTVKVIVG